MSHVIVKSTMSRLRRMSVQNYPRCKDGFLDDSKLIPHSQKLPDVHVKALVKAAIIKANGKSGREILAIPTNANEEQIAILHVRAGKELFDYFHKYCGDPAATSYQIKGKNFRDVASEAFRNRTLQKGRMNSGWRYQFLVVDVARDTQRFINVGDIGTSAGDFNAMIKFLDATKDALNLYVSVKNRVNTMGGADWPKAIEALELAAIQDKNKTGPYCCIFGIAMDHGYRKIKKDQKSKRPHSINTEVWLSDYFWPFFTNYQYEEIMRLFLEVLIESEEKPEELPSEIEIPDLLLNSFGTECHEAGLLDELGNFNDPFALMTFFCARKQR